MPLMSWQQGMPSLMTGMSDSRPTIPSPSPSPSLMNYQPGYWSQLAYQMAGSPNQGPSPSVSVPAGSGPASSSGGGGGGGIGGTTLGLLGMIAKNPSLMKSAYNGISGLLGQSAAETAAIGPSADAAATATAGELGSMPVAAITPELGLTAAAPAADGIAGLMAGGSPAMASIGTGSVDAATASAAASSSAATGASSGAALGAGAGAASALGIFAIPALLASTVKQHDRNASQYASMLSSLNAGPSDPGYNGAAMEIAADIANGQTQEYPSQILQKARQLGLYNTAQSLSAYKGPIGGGGPTVSGKRQ